MSAIAGSGFKNVSEILSAWPLAGGCKRFTYRQEGFRRKYCLHTIYTTIARWLAITRRARQMSIEHDVSPSVRPCAYRIRRSKECHSRRTHSDRQVHRAGVAGNNDVAFLKCRCQLAQRGLSREIKDSRIVWKLRLDSSYLFCIPAIAHEKEAYSVLQ